MAAVTVCSDFGASQNKVCHCFHCFPIYLPWSDGTRCHILVFWVLSFKPSFSLSSFTFIKRLFSSSSLSAMADISEVIDISPGNLDSSLYFIQSSISHDLSLLSFFFPIYLLWADGTGCHDLHFSNVEFLSSFTFIKRFLVPLHFLPLEGYHLHIWG